MCIRDRSWRVFIEVRLRNLISLPLSPESDLLLLISNCKAMRRVYCEGTLAWWTVGNWTISHYVVAFRCLNKYLDYYFIIKTLNVHSFFYSEIFRVQFSSYCDVINFYKGDTITEGKQHLCMPTTWVSATTMKSVGTIYYKCQPRVSVYKRFIPTVFVSPFPDSIALRLHSFMQLSGYKSVANIESSNPSLQLSYEIPRFFFGNGVYFKMCFALSLIHI